MKHSPSRKTKHGQTLSVIITIAIKQHKRNEANDMTMTTNNNIPNLKWKQANNINAKNESDPHPETARMTPPINSKTTSMQWQKQSDEENVEQTA